MSKHLYQSTDLNAPVLTGETGKLLDLLDAVLVNGLTTVSVTSITRSGATATVTTSANHGLLTGQSALIAGAVETDYNGTFPVTVTSSTVFTYTVPGTPTSPATGTITSRRAPAGWSIEHTASGKRVYYMGAASPARKRLRILDNGPGTGSFREARAYGAQSFSDVDTGVTMFPTAAQLAAGIIIRKSNTLDTTARVWRIIATDRFFILAVQDGGTANVWSNFYFGEFYSEVAGDTNNCAIVGRITELAANANVTWYETAFRIEGGNFSNAAAMLLTNGCYIAGDVAGGAGSFQFGKATSNLAFAIATTADVGGQLSFPNPADGALAVSRFTIYTGTAIGGLTLRGHLLGMYQLLHPAAGFTDGTTYAGSGDLASATLIIQKVTGCYAAHGSNGSSATVGAGVLQTSTPTYSS